MKNIAGDGARTVLGRHLEELGALEPIRLGKPPPERQPKPERAPTQEDSKKLGTALEESRKKTDQLLMFLAFVLGLSL
ncbi:MAG: hypothetical protein MN733_22150, partial [Nitrososphaera sp.]|nr:hypothetical protein [Nitrososphaera sp.]